MKQLVSNFHASPELISPKSVAHFLPKSVAHFPKVGGSFSRSRWFIFPKSVAHFPVVGGSFSQSGSLIFPNLVAHFPKVGGSFSQSRWLIFPKSVADFHTTEPVLQKPNRFFTKTGASVFSSNKASLSLKRSLCCCFNLG